MQRAVSAAVRPTKTPGGSPEQTGTRVRSRLAVSVAALAAALALGCGGDPSDSSPGSTSSGGGSGAANSTAGGGDTAPVQPVDLVARGRSVYNANCIACHAMNPSQEGALGPAVHGSSLELLEARVMRAEYPEGYSPKRPSRLMVAMPHLEREVAALHAYLNSQS